MLSLLVILVFNLTNFTKIVMSTAKERFVVFMLRRSTKAVLFLFGLLALTAMTLASGMIDTQQLRRAP